MERFTFLNFSFSVQKSFSQVHTKHFPFLKPLICETNDAYILKLYHHQICLLNKKRDSVSWVKIRKSKVNTISKPHIVMLIKAIKYVTTNLSSLFKITLVNFTIINTRVLFNFHRGKKKTNNLFQITWKQSNFILLRLWGWITLLHKTWVCVSCKLLISIEASQLHPSYNQPELSKSRRGGFILQKILSFFLFNITREIKRNAL